MTTTRHRNPLEFQRRNGEVTGISATLENPPSHKGSVPSDGIRVQVSELTLQLHVLSKLLVTDAYVLRH